MLATDRRRTNSCGVVVRLVAAGDELWTVYIRQLVRSTLRPSVLARVDRLPPLARTRPIGGRLVPELGNGDARAQRVRPLAGGGVPRLQRPHLGDHGIRQPPGLCRMGRTAAPPGDRRHRRPGRGRRLADVCARDHRSRPSRDAPSLRRSHLWTVRVRRCLPPNGRLGQSRRHRHRSGITLLSAPRTCERGLSGRFLQNPEIAAAFTRIELPDGRQLQAQGPGPRARSSSV